MRVKSKQLFKKRNLWRKFLSLALMWSETTYQPEYRQLQDKICWPNLHLTFGYAISQGNVINKGNKMLI